MSCLILEFKITARSYEYQCGIDFTVIRSEVKNGQFWDWIELLISEDWLVVEFIM
jgi:hypothetical protein